MHSRPVADGDVNDVHHASNGAYVTDSSRENDPVINEAPLHTKRHISIVCVGAGVSGLCVAMKFQEKLTDYDFHMYEKNPELGGTWYENRYPGCACKIINCSWFAEPSIQANQWPKATSQPMSMHTLSNLTQTIRDSMISRNHLEEWKG
jgi:hypothetical protein